MNKRNTGIDLLKIICMIMILFIHLIGREELQNNFNPSESNYLIIILMKSFCCIAVNCYFLVTGYYTINRKIKFSKILKIWGTTLFYTISFFIIFLFIRKGNVTRIEVMKSLFPVFTESYWFVTVYIAVCLLSPIISIIITKLSKKQYTYFIIVLIIIMSLVETIYPQTGVFNYGKGINFATMMLMYLIGGYIKLHWNLKDKSSKKYLLGYVAMSLIIFIQTIVLAILSYWKPEIFKIYYNRAIAYNSILVIISSILFFLHFETLEVKNQKIDKMINVIKPLTFAVYIIHEDIFIRLKTVNAIQYQASSFFIPYLLFCIIGIFIICCLIEGIRQKIFATLRIGEKFGEKLDKWEDKLLEE